MLSSSILTYRYRIKDATSGKHLQRLAWAVNTVWNFCNEVSLMALRRDKRWLTAYDLINLCAGASAELGLHADTIAEVCREYVAKRRASGKRRLKWHSRKRSLESRRTIYYDTRSDVAARLQEVTLWANLQ